MSRANEFTPLLVPSDEHYNVRPPRRRSAWQYVLVGALGLGVLSLFHQRQPLYSTPVDVEDVTVSFNTPTASDVDDVAFLSTMETFKDPSVDPCVDFYEYACGGWLKTHEIPSDRPSIDSSFYVVSEANKNTIQKIFDQNPPQIGQFYHSCLNDQEVDAEAVHFVAQLIENIHQTNSTVALMGLAGEMDQSLGISTFFSIFVGADPEDPSTNVLQFSQGGLTLPSREYYLEESKVDAYATLYVDYVTKLFAVGGLDSHNVTEYAQAVLETETALAKISLSNAALRDPWTTNKAYPFPEIATRYPFLMAYLNGIYKLEPFPMLHAIVATPDFFEAQNKLLSDESLLPQLKNYLSFHLIDSFGAVLGEYFRRASHEFHGKIQGAGALLPRDQFCVRLTTAFLGDELGKYYMEDVFGPDAKAAAQALVAEIEESLKALLLTEAWLDKVTYDAAVEKLIKVKNYIGGPDDVPPLPFELQADAFFNNVKSLMQLSAAGTIQSINRPVDEKAWDMFPSTVNAYYDPSANKMVFPAAILQPPFYSAEHFPAAANFARIGMVMGHELSHGFDDQGRNYDGNGALRSWWTPSVSAEFAEKAQCLAAQYSSFPVVSIEDGHVLGMVNGNLTLGENIADNGGIHLAYEAYQLWKSTFAPPVPIEPSPPVEPAETPSPVVPIPDVPVPEPTETGPGGEVPVVTSPPVLPVPEADTPEPAPTEPSGEIPVATPSQPPVIPEPEPTNIGPGGVIPEDTSPAPELPVPEEQTPAPTETEPPTAAPVETPAPTTVPTPPVVPDVPDTPTPPNVPDIPTPPVPTPPPVIVPPQPEPTTDAPKHKKKKEEPSEEPKEKEHDRKHRKDDSEKDKKSDKSESSEDGKSHKHSDKKDDDGKKSQGSKHGHNNRDDKDEKGKSKKDSGDEKKEDHHRHEENSESKDEDSKKHNTHSKDSKEDDESSTHSGKSKHRHEDETERDSGRKHRHGKEEEDEDKHEHRRENDEEYDRKHRHHEKQEEEDERHKHGHGKEDGAEYESRHDEDEDYDRKHRHHEKGEEEDGRHKHDHREYESRHERREERHRRDEEGDEDEDRDRRRHKHHGHDGCDDCEDEEGHGHHGKRNYRWDEDEGESDLHKHHKHDKKEEKRERKERKQQRKADEVFEGKHHHRWDYDDDGYAEDHDWRRHHKHHRHEEEREEHWECGDCGREHKHHRHKHEEDWDKEWKYPFSGGDVKIHSMIEKLARAIAQPNDPVADDRLFFTAFAQNWCEKRTPGYAELLRTIDPHSPGKWRVNGPLMNYDKFAEVFSCPVGTPMNPEKKCVIW